MAKDMSDTDDTDLLLIIPPDFFNVRSSDSEESDFSGIRRDSDISNHIVRDLVNHVNQLESRVCSIESRENLVSSGRSLDCSVAVDSADIKHGDVALSFYSMTSTGYRFGTSLDCNRSALHTSWKQKPQSLPATPGTHHQRFQLIPDILGHSYANAIHEREKIHSFSGTTFHDDKIKSNTSQTDNLLKNDSARTILSDSSDSYPIFSEPDDPATMSYQDMSFLSEIDEFLENKRADATTDAMENSDLKSKLEKNSINSNKKGISCTSFDNMNKPASSFHPDGNSVAYDKRLTLSDVDKLLLQMDKKQSEIEQKLNVVRPSYHSPVPLSYSCDRPPSIYCNNRKQFFDRNPNTFSASAPESQSYNGTVSSSGRCKDVYGELQSAMNDVCTEGNKPPETGKLEEISVCKKISMIGDNIGSVPDLGCGVRNIMMQPSSNVSNKTLSINSDDQRGHVTSANICVKGRDTPKKYSTEESMCVSMISDNISSMPDSGYGVQNSMIQSLENANHPPPQNVSVDERKNAASENKLDSHSSVINMSGSLHQLRNMNPTKKSDASGRNDIRVAVSIEERPTVQSSSVDDGPLCYQELDRPCHSLSHGSMHSTSRNFTNIHESKEKDNNQKECYTENNVTQLQQPLGATTFPVNNLADTTVQNKHWNVRNVPNCVEQVDSGIEKEMEQATISGKNSNDDTDSVRMRRMREMPSSRVDFSGHTYSGKITRKKVEFSRESSNTLIKGKSGLWSNGGSSVFQVKKNGQYDNTSTSSGPLLSLSELWGSDSSGHNQKSSNIEQRLEEEVYRRQHCERLVQELQRQLLEEREKLAVAMRVDESKDYAISQLQTAWDKLVGHWHDLEEERNELAQRLQDDRIAAAQEITEMQEKVKSVERELSRALELAQGYQTRCSEMESELVKEKSSTEATVALSEAKMLNLNNEIASITAERDRLLTRVSDVEMAITKDRSLLKEAEAEMKKMQETTKNQEAEIHFLKQQSETLLLRLNEAKSKNQVLENSKTAVQKALEETKKKEKETQSELKEVVEKMKQEKLKLRDTYQQQVETLVREKVQEFQSQLDAAEAALDQREKALAEMTSQQIKLLTEKYQMEVKLLEEKQQDEMKLYKIQLVQANQQIAKLQAQLQLQNKHRNELLEQLHDAMEAQWQEALRMVQGKGDAWTTGHQFNDVNISSHIKSPSKKDHSVSVTETTASDKYQFAKMLDTIKNAAAFQEVHPSDVPPLTLPPSSPASTADDEPFTKEDQLTYRVQENKQLSVSPGEELRKYIQQLLDRSPGNPIQDVTQESAERDIDKETEQPVRSLPMWEPVSTDQASVSSVTSASQFCISRDMYDTVKGTRNMKSNKPPWK